MAHFMYFSLMTTKVYSHFQRSVNRAFTREKITLEDMINAKNLDCYFLKNTISMLRNKRFILDEMLKIGFISKKIAM